MKGREENVHTGSVKARGQRSGGGGGGDGEEESLGSAGQGHEKEDGEPHLMMGLSVRV